MYTSLVIKKNYGYDAALHIQLFQVSEYGLVPLTLDNRGSTVFYSSIHSCINFHIHVLNNHCYQDNNISNSLRH